MVASGALVEITVMWLASLLHEERTAELGQAQRFVDLLSARSTSDAAARDLCAALLGGEPGTAVSGLHELVDRVVPRRPPRLAQAVAEMLVLLAGLGGDEAEFRSFFERWRDWTSLPVPDPHPEGKLTAVQN